MKFQARSGKRVVKVSKCGETYIDFYKLYEEYDPFLTSGGAESNSAWVTEVIIFSRLWNLFTQYLNQTLLGTFRLNLIKSKGQIHY